MWRFIIYRDLVYTNEISYTKTRSHPFCGFVLYTEISFVRSRQFFGVLLYTDISFTEKRPRICKRDIVHFVAFCYIPRSRFYKRVLVYENEISSILWRFIIYRDLAFTNEISYMKTEISSILWRCIIY